MKKLTIAFALSLLTTVLALAGPVAKDAKETPARDKPAAKEKGPCEKEREAKEKECKEKLGTGMAADACKKAAEHNEKNCKAAEEPK
ncbi:MAG: hypothetical protein KF715_08710 [Candidatus Didemnitutus sp.]|nr:hypothetical protein [Candidatus Didemnitutus sp.]